MPTARYASYDESTASRVVRWRRDSRYAIMAIWDPPATFSGPRPVYVFEPGGARQARRDLSIGNAENGTPGSGDWTTPGYMTNILGAYVVCVSTPPGGLDFEAAEETDQEYNPECRASAALAIMFLRANCDNTDVVGSEVAGRTIAPEPRYWIGGGVSAGCWNQLGAQLLPVGSFSATVDAEAARGSNFRYSHDHRVGHFLGNIGQNRLSSFSDYRLDAAFSADSEEIGSYLTNGPTLAGATTIAVDGDTADLFLGNRLQMVFDTGYTVASDTVVSNGSSNPTSVPITGSSTPVPRGVTLRFTAVQDNAPDPDTYVTVGPAVTVDYSGGTGNIDTRSWGYQTPSGEEDPVLLAGTTVYGVIEVCVTTDYSGGSGNVAVWPPVLMNVPDNAVIEFRRLSMETYGSFAWSGGYLGTASMGRVWRSNEPSGVGVPMQEKIDANVDLAVREDNPRAFELNIILSGGASESLHRIDSLTSVDSFWTRRNVDPGVVLPEYIDLHDAGDMAHLAHSLWLLRSAAGVNADGIWGYFSDRTKNPTGTGVVPADQPWLKGRSASYDYLVIQDFLTNPARYGGAVV